MRCYFIVRNEYESRILQFRLFRKGYYWGEEKSRQFEELETGFPCAIYFDKIARKDPHIIFSDLGNIELNGDTYKVLS